MSVEFLLRRPLTMPEIARLTNWKLWRTDDGRGLTDGTNYVHTNEDEEGRIVGFTSFMGNDCTALVAALDAVSEQNNHDPDFTRLFGDPGH
jgi:hypothetical protein